MDRNRQTGEAVVLVHGLFGSRFDMWPISRRLRRMGYRVNNWGYYSLSRIEKPAGKLIRQLRSIDEDPGVTKFHLVTHSLGGIVARAALAESHFDKLTRVVMLAPPHRGSFVARRVWPFFNPFAPCLKQLSDAPNSYVNQLENSLHARGIEFGIVEASKDRVIASDCVQLEGQRDFARVTGQHAILTWYSQTIELVENFLVHGQFSPLASSSSSSAIGRPDERTDAA